jgi:hypothetical protein
MTKRRSAATRTMGSTYDTVVVTGSAESPDPLGRRLTA